MPLLLAEPPLEPEDPLLLDELLEPEAPEEPELELEDDELELGMLAPELEEDGDEVGMLDELELELWGSSQLASIRHSNTVEARVQAGASLVGPEHRCCSLGFIGLSCRWPMPFTVRLFR